MRTFKLYLCALASFLLLDALWLGIIARDFYKEKLGYLLAATPNWYAAAIFYVLFVAAILHFVVVPGLKAQSVRLTLWKGAFFGWVTYAAYDLTNLATVRDWPLSVTVVDMLWGGFLCATTAAVGYTAGKVLKA